MIEIRPAEVIANCNSENEWLNKALETARQKYNDTLNFTGDDTLKGQAWDSMRSHMQEVWAYWWRIATLAIETKISTNDRLKETAEAYWGSAGRISEEDFQNQLTVLNGIRDRIQDNPAVAVAFGGVLEGAIGLVQSQIEKIYAYCDTTNNLYSSSDLDFYISCLNRANDALSGCSFASGTGFSGIDTSWIRDYQDKFSQSGGSSFVRTMQDEYGFDAETSELMWQVYARLKEEDPENAEQRFLALLAGMCYNGFKWNTIANIPSTEDIGGILKDLGLTGEEIQKLTQAVRDQHNACTEIGNPLYGKSDFAHWCATTATILNGDWDKSIGNLAGVFNGTYDIDANAGYIGDVCGTNGADPSMGNDDYHADLDAVNIAVRLRKDSNASLSDVFNDYYGGNVNRAKEFKENIGMDTLYDQQEAFHDWVKQKIYSNYGYQEGSNLSLSNSLTEEEYKDQTKTMDQFIKNLEEENEDWK